MFYSNKRDLRIVHQGTGVIYTPYDVPGLKLLYYVILLCYVYSTNNIMVTDAI